MYIYIYTKKHLRSRKGLLKTFVLHSALSLSIPFYLTLSSDRRLHPLSQHAFSRFFPLFLKNLVCTFIFSGFFLFPFYPPHSTTVTPIYVYHILEIFSRAPSNHRRRQCSAHSFRSLPRSPPPVYSRRVAKLGAKARGFSSIHYLSGSPGVKTLSRFLN